MWNHPGVVSKRCKPIETFLSLMFNELCFVLTRHGSLLAISLSCMEMLERCELSSEFYGLLIISRGNLEVLDDAQCTSDV